jgi:hypothetical protein
VAALDAKIAAAKRRVVEIHEGEKLEGKSDEDIARMLSAANL